MNYDIAVVLGRFQLPHKAHFQLIHKALEVADHVIIGLGSSNLRRSLRNPFSVDQRISLIQGGSNIVQDSIANKRLYFVGIEDSCYSDQWWIEHVQRKIKETIQLRGLYPRKPFVGKKPPKHKIALVGHKKDDTSYYLDMFPQWEYVGIEASKIMSATECRKVYYKYGLDDKSVQNTLAQFTTWGVREALKHVPTQVYNDLKARYEFVENYKKEWGEGPHYTADAVVIKSGHLLLITRGQQPDIGAWAFPGGFINKKETSHTASVRECLEETGLDIRGDKDPFEHLVDYKEYQSPFRDERGDIRTTACLYNLGMGDLPEVKGDDDAAHAEWVPVADLTASNMFGDHYFIYRDLIRKI
jgi:bifunctional NMN adenylyltransferase/nudix hydrolase